MVSEKRIKEINEMMVFFLIFLGIVLIIMSFVSEIYFHYYSGIDFSDEQQFWRLESSEVLNSMTFLVLGIIILSIGLYYRREMIK
ncbi:MAG: hypothetical protein ACFFG0_20820 [Candidatus Thorarchaeota archaeon]